jgi:hypothetical protein
MGWYTKANLQRLWAGMRRGEDMTCHPTDPDKPGPSGGTPVRGAQSLTGWDPRPGNDASAPAGPGTAESAGKALTTAVLAYVAAKVAAGLEVDRDRHVYLEFTDVSGTCADLKAVGGAPACSSASLPALGMPRSRRLSARGLGGSGPRRCAAG